MGRHLLWEVLTGARYPGQGVLKGLRGGDRIFWVIKGGMDRVWVGRAWRTPGGVVFLTQNGLAWSVRVRGGPSLGVRAGDPG